MSKSDLEAKNLEIMKGAKNYNRWIYNNIKKFLGKRVLEVGGGEGAMTEFLLQRRKVVSTDISKEHVKQLEKRFSGNVDFNAELLDVSKSFGDLAKYSFDTVAIINVLEHIKDDIKTLENMHQLLSSDGKLVLVLPAFSFAYGTIDESDNHYRRYDKSVIPKIRKIGFKIKKVRYMNLPGLLGWIWHGKILKLKVHKKGDLSLFDKLTPVFELFETVFPFLPGLSLIVVCEK